MKQNIILAGVGGQGILSIAAVIDLAALHSGLDIRQAEVHGMSQRGGAVESHLRIADREIHSDLIARGTADIVISVEPLEALRQTPWLAPSGRLVTAMEPVVNMEGYPPMETVRRSLLATGAPILIDALQLAEECGSRRASNMVVLGAAAPFISIPPERLEAGISELFERKGADIAAINIRAFRKGLAASQQQAASPEGPPTNAMT
ncbi:MAG: indolepyruvate oxidoreductase [Pelodictyon luteolum]|uniref:Indolepyruvate oxidoreductase n=1 Tax=Pelodictyon luteolum TaxID=1100 RepID=A0A165MAV6_PELLU|nr:indolepyruvate oxidoreductase subunit beta [Pelodictyon luteolum]KZK75026.1 MAG: indolepyruvate oxidoreductase [Pelodictyon luteolum]